MSSPRIPVLFTLPQEYLHEATRLLPATRFDVVPCPLVNTAARTLTAAEKSAVQSAPGADYVVFQSQIAAMYTVQALMALRIAPTELNRTVICATNPGIAHWLSTRGISTNLIPKCFTTESLLDLLPRVKRPCSVFLPRAENTTDALANSLIAKGYALNTPALYTAAPANALSEQSQRSLASQTVKCLAFTSPATVAGLETSGALAILESVSRPPVIAAIGPATAARCDRAGLRAGVVPKDFTLQALTRAIYRHFQGSAF